MSTSGNMMKHESIEVGFAMLQIDVDLFRLYCIKYMMYTTFLAGQGSDTPWALFNTGCNTGGASPRITISISRGT